MVLANQWLIRTRQELKTANFRLETKRRMMRMMARTKYCAPGMYPDASLEAMRSLISTLITVTRSERKLTEVWALWMRLTKKLEAKIHSSSPSKRTSQVHQGLVARSKSRSKCSSVKSHQRANSVFRCHQVKVTRYPQSYPSTRTISKNLRRLSWTTANYP